MKQPQDKLSHDRFNFETWHEVTENGTAGCMAGELAALFPRSWKATSDEVRLRSSRYRGLYTLDQVAYFFGLSEGETRHLFCPWKQTRTIDPQCKSLSKRATKAQVVKNLRRFLEIRNILEH